MKNNLLRVLILILLILSILVFIYVSFSDFELLKIKGNSKENFYFYLKLFIACYFGVLLLLVFRKKYNLAYFFHLLWLIPILILFLSMVYGSSSIKKIDFLIGRNQKVFEVTEYIYKTEQIKRIVVGQDTLLYSPLPCCVNQGYSLEEIQNAKISKSWITGYYYLSIPKKVQNNSTIKILPINQ